MTKRMQKLTARVALRSLEEVIANAKPSKNARGGLPDGSGRDEKPQKGVQVEMNILCVSRRPTRDYVLWEGPEDTLFIKAVKNVLVRWSPTSLRSSVVAPLHQG